MKRKMLLAAVAVLILAMLTVTIAATQDPDPGSAPRPTPQADEGADPASTETGTADGQTPAQADEAGDAPESAQGALASIGTAFTYQGRLTDGGAAANATYEFSFKLFDALTLGNQVGPTINTDVGVSNGLFTANLDFGAVITGTALYLDIGVRPDGSVDPYTTLSPRQAITPAPYALTLRPGADVIGAQTNNAVVEAHNTATAGSTSYALRGETDSTAGSVAAIYGRVTSTAPGGFSTGVRGVNEGTGGNGIGIWGSQNGRGWGVYGTVVSGTAVFGDAGSIGANIGVRGDTSSAAGYAGFFANSGGAGGVGLYTSGGDNAAPDIVLGGNDDGRIASDPAYAGSDIFLTSNDAVVVQLDSDGGVIEDADFEIQRRGGSAIFNVDESGEVSVFTSALTETVEIVPTEGIGDGAQIALRNAAGQSTIVLDAEFGAGGNGRITTEVLQITGGADLSEQFEVRSARGGPQPSPGAVVCIDAEHLGQLALCSQAYQRTVAGVISGAGGLKPGLMMGQGGTHADGRYPVALTGRVYVWADASNGAIAPGDLLTTSTTPGIAMKVTDYGLAQGAILGKAMSGLSHGQGLVLVLVTLQ